MRTPMPWSRRWAARTRQSRSSVREFRWWHGCLLAACGVFAFVVAVATDAASVGLARSRAVPASSAFDVWTRRPTKHRASRNLFASRTSASARTPVTRWAAEVLLEGTELYGSHDDIRTLFRIPKLVIRKGQKLAVVGSNGCGKSTLLTALAGKSALANGQVQLQPGCRVGFVEQVTDYNPDKTVTEIVFESASSPQAAAFSKYQVAAKHPEDANALQAAVDAMEEANAWDWEAHAKKVMLEVGLTEDLQARKVSQLSGGEERRVALAAALVDIQGTDLLILDEPTNHLSAEGCEWLQERIRQEPDLSVMLVTHDRYFLDEVCDEILEIDGLGSVYKHPGGWNSFLTRRAQRLADKASEAEAAKVQLKRAEEWMKRGVRGRGTKNKAQIQGYYQTKERAETTIAADDGAPELAKNFAQRSEGGGRTEGSKINVGVFSLANATVRIPGRGDVFKKASFSFGKGMKVGITGPNGAGKSTFLKALAGEVPLDEGTRKVGPDLRIGYLSQDPPEWANPKQKVISVVGDLANDVLASEDGFFRESQGMTKERATANLLRSVNFAQERWQTQVQMLSGGERRRLHLLKVLASNPNVLLLDEPTNDLDAVTVDALERLLQNFKGTIVVVSHDRSLLDGVCNMHLVLEKGSDIRVWTGTHAELREFEKMKRTEAEEVAASAVEQSVASKAPKKRDAKAQAQAKRQLQKVEKQIEKLEARLAEVQEAMQRDFADAEKVMELHEEQQKLEQEQAEMYEQWEELASAVAE